jgi:hypothetical protein
MEAGAIPAINNPEYVSPGEVQMPPGAWIIGVEMDGVERAYSLNMLTRFSVVNDTINGRDVVLFFDPIGNAAALYDRKIGGEAMSFFSAGALYHGSLVVSDEQSKSFWSVVTGEAIGGPHQGKTLSRIPAVHRTVYGDWLQKHPNTEVFSVQGTAHVDENPYIGYVRSADPVDPPKKMDKKLPPKVPVYGFNLDGKSYAIAQQAAFGGWRGKAGSSQVLVWRPPGSPAYYGTRAYNLGALKLKETDGVWEDKKKGKFDPMTGAFANGETLEPLNGVDTFWYVWSGLNSMVKLLNPPRRGFSQFDQPRTHGITAADDPTKRQEPNRKGRPSGGPCLI